MSAEPQAPEWFLMSVLFSSVSLTPKLAIRLQHAAFDLYRKDAGELRLAGDLVQGQVRNLRKELLLGTICGHEFEAEVDTEHGHGRVRFLLTQEGIDALAQSLPKQLLN